MREGPKARALTEGWRNISIGKGGGRTGVYLILLSLILSFLTFAPITAKAAFAEPSGSWTDRGNFDISWNEANTSADYFQIDTPAKLAGVAKLVNSGRASFFEKRNPGDSSKRQQIIRITAPIDLSAHLWEPIGNGIDSSLTFLWNLRRRRLSDNRNEGRQQRAIRGVFRRCRRQWHWPPPAQHQPQRKRQQLQQ